MLFSQWFICIAFHAFVMGIAIENCNAFVLYKRASSCYQTIYVDSSGQGNFSTIQSAIDSIPSNNSQWIRIYIKAGSYKEQVEIPYDKQFIYLKGEGRKVTNVTWNSHDDIETCATFKVYADNIVVKEIKFVNSYNVPWNASIGRRQAVAALITGDKCSFYGCAFVGLQDTLWDVRGRHYFYRSSIVGAIDFIFGAGQSIYERCSIYVTAGQALYGLAGYVTAQARTGPNESNGFVFKHSKVFGTGQAFLGRPWRDYARVLFYKTTMSDVVVPQGWNAWNSVGHENQLTFAETLCNGRGARGKRVEWETKLSDEEWSQFTNISFIDTEGWISRQP